MDDTVQRYISYDKNGEIKLSIPTILFGGYDREQTCEMVRELSDYYKVRIMQLMDALAEKERENDQLRQKIS
ncbi:MAG: hypothetical protein Q4P20_03400 [Eubacteriales bacterium]|nr:hypothetical protein [Eubacteriales bacterium]